MTVKTFVADEVFDTVGGRIYVKPDSVFDNSDIKPFELMADKLDEMSAALRSNPDFNLFNLGVAAGYETVSMALRDVTKRLREKVA